MNKNAKQKCQKNYGSHIGSLSRSCDFRQQANLSGRNVDILRFFVCLWLDAYRRISASAIQSIFNVDFFCSQF
jgi:hypothetical protein